MKTIGIASAAALAACLAFALQSGSAAPAPAGPITVQGAGSVTAVPDRAQFTFGVTSPAKTAAAAMAANAAASARVVAALKQAGIAAADLQTTQISLDVRTSQNGDTIVGYTASSSVSALVRALAQAGSVVDAAVAAGADSVSGPNLAVGDSSALYRQALKAAVADARAKAETLAAASDLTLGRVTSVAENGAQPVPLPAAAPANGAGTAIEPGTQEVQANVTVTFAAA
jgi:uncharacterized protein YggE